MGGLFRKQQTNPFEGFTSSIQADESALIRLNLAMAEGIPLEEALTTCMANASENAMLFAQNNVITGESVAAFTKEQQKSNLMLISSNKGMSVARGLIDEYNTGCVNCGLSQSEFATTVSGSNRVLGNYLSGLNGAEASMGGYILSLAGAKLATLGLRVATMALNAALTMGVSMLVSGAISAISDWIHEEEKARDKSIELGEQAVETSKNLFQLATKYIEVSKAVKSGTASNEDFTKAQDDVIEALKNTGVSVDELIEKYGDLETGIKKVTLEKLKESNTKIQSGLTSSKEKAQDELNLFGKSTEEKLNAVLTDSRYETVDENNRILEYLYKQGYATENKNYGLKAATDSRVKYYFNDLYEDDGKLSIDQLKKNYDYLKETANLVAKEFGTDNKIYEQLSKSLNSYSENLDPVISKITEANQGIARELVYEQQLNGDIPKSLDEYIQIRDNLAKKLSEDNRFDKSFGDDASALIDTELSSNSAFNKYAKEYVKREKEIKDLSKKKAEIVKSLGIKNGKDRDWVYDQDKDTVEIMYKLSSEKKYEHISDLKKDVSEFVASGKSIIADSDKIDFSTLVNATDEGTFMDSVNKYIEKINALKDAVSKRESGDFTESDLVELIKQFPELADQTDNLDEAIDKLITDSNKGMSDKFSNQLKYMSSQADIDKLKGLANSVLQLGNVVEEVKPVLDLDTVSDGLNKVNSAIKESVSATGMSEQAIKDLTDRYKILDDFDAAKLFEKTSNGIHANTSELRKLEAAYQKQEMGKITDELDSQVTLYNELTKRINASTDAGERAALYQEREKVLDRIEDTAELASQYEGLTSAFKNWSDAQSIGEEGDNYDSLVNSLENIKDLYEKGLIGTNKFRTAVQLMSNEDLSNASVDKLVSVYDTNYNKIVRYFQDGSDGCLNFLNDVQSINKKWVHMNQDGSWQIDFGVGGDEDVAEALGINVETVQSILRKLSDFGFDIKLDSVFSNLSLLKTEAEKANETLIKIGKTKYKFNFNSDDINDVKEQLSKAKEIFDGFKKNKDGTIDLSVEGAKEASDILTTLILSKQNLEEPVVMKVDLSKVEDTQLKNDLDQIQKIVSTHNKIELKAALGENTDKLKEDLNKQIQQASKDENQILVGLTVDENTSYDQINNQINNWSKDHSEMLVKIATKDSEVQEESNKIKRAIQSAIDGVRFDLKFSNDAMNKLFGTTITIKVNADTTQATSNLNQVSSLLTRITNNTGLFRIPVVSPALEAAGFKRQTNPFPQLSTGGGFSFASGSNNISSNGIGLVGELGRELVVRNGKYFTIGDNGATMFKYQKGDIIFDAKQTEQLLSNGEITTGNTRGRAFSSGSGTFRESGKTKTNPTGKYKKGDTTKKEPTDKSNKSEDYQTIDWIEVAISRIERAIERLRSTASNAFKSLKTRLSATSKEISSVNSEISLQTKAYNRYLKQANSVKLSSDLKKKVQNGTIDITKYKGGTADLIEEYKKWYEKSLEAKDNIKTLHENLAQLYKDNFENTENDYKNRLSLIENQTDKYDNMIDILETKGYLKSTAYYGKLQKVESQRIALLKKEYTDLNKQLNKAMASGEIEKYSEEWYNMQKSIQDVAKSIDDANLNLLKYSKTIREIQWSYFDYAQDRISQITKESEFLINILGDSKLFTDNGQFNNKGITVVGLHAQNYNVDMVQADKYAKEIQKINKEIAKDPYNTDLIKRREELLKLQQDSIKAAEGEKQAIVDLVKKGIDIELESLKKIINLRKENLDQTKDAYEYQKKIDQKTKNISSLQKQLSAYQGDLSEESRTRIQKLQVELENAETDLKETEYEKYVSDSKKLLDDLYEEYETTLNQRLDNVDALVKDMINTVNDKSEVIKQTLINESKSLGYTLSQSMKEIWDTKNKDDKTVVSFYGNNFTAKLTTINDVLNKIEAKVATMIKVSDNGGTPPKGTTKETPSSKPKTGSTPSPTPKTKPTSTPKTNPKPKGTTPQAPKLDQATKEKVAAAIWNGSLGWGAGKDRINRLSEVFGANNGIQDLVSKRVGINYNGKDLNQYSYANMRKKFKGYRLGGIVDYTGLAQVHGTPTNPEVFLNSSDAKNFLSLRDSLRGLANNNISIVRNRYELPKASFTGLNSMPDISDRLFEQSNLNSVGDININIPIEHVEDYNDFVRQLKSDGKFEKFIRSVTIDRLNGKGSLEKNKYS